MKPNIQEFLPPAFNHKFEAVPEKPPMFNQRDTALVNIMGDSHSGGWVQGQDKKD